MNALLCTLAGKSSRMGQPKQHLVINGRTFLEHICETVSQFKHILEPMIFVGNKEDQQSPKIISKFQGIWVINEEVEKGPIFSIRLGLKYIPKDIGFLLWPIDHPLIMPETVKAILEVAGEQPDAIVVPSDGERRGHPTRFPPWARQELLSAPLDTGAKYVLNRFSQKVRHVVVSDPWIIWNINTPEKFKLAIENI